MKQSTRLVWLLAAWVGLVPTPRLGDHSKDVRPPAYIDFEEMEHPGPIPRNPHGGLRLLIHPFRLGTSDLQLDIEVWNLSSKTQRIGPVTPDSCHVGFYDAAGKGFFPYKV